MPQEESQTEERASDVRGYECKCPVHQDKPKRLVLRPDLAGEEGGYSIIALCIFSKPVAVHEWSGEDYVLREDLEFKDNQILKDGEVFAMVAPPNLAELLIDDEDETQPDSKPERRDQGGSRPVVGDHVDIDRDEFY